MRARRRIYARPVLFSVSAGKWDRFTSWGVKLKDGEESVFNEDTLGQMVENFAQRVNDIPLCYDHQSAYVELNGQPAPALAFYNALCLVVDGKVAKFAAHDPSVAPPDASGLENGLYGYRSEITPLGEQLLPNYKYISPMFFTEAEDEEGKAIGYDLIDVAATNTPFQDGVGFTFGRMGMDSDMLAKLGLGEGASPDEMKGAFKKYMADCEAKMAEQDAALKKMADDMEAMKAAKMADDAKDADAMDKADGDPDGDGDKDKEDKQEMAKALGLSRFSFAAARAALTSRFVDAEEFGKVKAELAAIKAEAETKALEAWADEAVALGRWPSDKRDSLVKFARADRQGAEEALAKKGTFTLVARTYAKELTRVNPNPVATGDADKRIVGAEFAEKAKAYAKEKNVSLAEAQIAVAKAHPELVKG